MRYFISILFIAIYSLAAIHITELGKMPILIKHYCEHKKGYSDMDFLTYLQLHYNQKIPHDEKDNTLPFKNHECNCSLAVSITPPVSVTITSKNSTLLSIPVFLPQDIDLVTDACLSQVWQPPRLQA